MFQNKIKKSIIFSIVIFLAIWIVVGFLSLEIDKKKKETADLLSDITLKSSKKNEIKFLATKLVELDSEIKKTDTFLLGVDQDELVRFIEKLEAMGKVAGIKLTIDSIEVLSEEEKDVEKSNYENLNLKLNAEGNFKQVFHFANLIENLPYHVEIEQMSLNVSTEFVEKLERLVWREDFILKVSKLR